MLMLPSSIREAMIVHALEGLPSEICGILGGKVSEVSIHSLHPQSQEKRSPLPHGPP